MTQRCIAPLLVSVIFLLLLLTPFDLSAKAPLQQIEFTPQELKNIKGHYSTVYGYVYIQVNGKQVSTRVDDKFIRLYKKSDGRIYPKYKLLRIFPIDLGKMSFALKESNGKQQILMYAKTKKAGRDSIKIVAQKFKPIEIPKYWKSKLGKYKATLLKGKSSIKKIRLAEQRGVLVAYINKISSPYPLVALSATSLYSPSAGHNKSRQINIASVANKIMLKYGKNSLILKKL